MIPGFRLELDQAGKSIPRGMSPGLGGELRVFSTGPANLCVRYHGNLKRHIRSHPITQSCVESCRYGQHVSLKAAGVRALVRARCCQPDPPLPLLMKRENAKKDEKRPEPRSLIAASSAYWLNSQPTGTVRSRAAFFSHCGTHQPARRAHGDARHMEAGLLCRQMCMYVHGLCQAFSHV